MTCLVDTLGFVPVKTLLLISCNRAFYSIRIAKYSYIIDAVT